MLVANSVVAAATTTHEAVTVAAASARIGDAASALEAGVISFVNDGTGLLKAHVLFAAKRV